MRALGVDLGGSKILGVVLEEGGSEGPILETPTPRDAGGLARALLQLIRALSRRGEVAAVGVAAAGLVDEGGRVLRYAPNLPLREFPLARLLEEELEAVALVENDATAAAFAEWRLGAGRGFHDMVMVTLGTGIGGGLVLGGQLYRGGHGLAGEVGHMVVVEGGPPCACGRRGCWEAVASSRALQMYALEEAAREPGSVLASSPAPSGVEVSAALAQGDRAAERAVTRLGRYVGLGVANIVNLLDPEVVVLGGGLAELGEALLAPCRDAVSEGLVGRDFRPPPEVRRAELGRKAGAVGAALMALKAAGRSR